MAITNTLQALRDDHKRIRGLFRQEEGVSRRTKSMQAGVSKEILMELEIHLHLEEKYFYDQVKNKLTEASDRSIATEVLHDHHRFKGMIKQLKLFERENQEYFQKLFDFIEEVEFHFSKEENEIFQKFENQVESAFKDKSSEMMKEREALLNSNRYQDSRPEVVQDPGGGEQRRKRHVA